MAIQQRSQLKGFGQSTNEKYIVLDVNDIVSSVNNIQQIPYKVYTAIINQFGINPPTVTVLQNTIGTISFQYNGVGLYSAVSAGLFIEGKTFAFISTSPDTNSHAVIASSGGGNNSARGIQTSISGVYSNDVLSGSALEIRVYN